MFVRDFVKSISFIACSVAFLIIGIQTSAASTKYSMGVEDFIDFLPYSDYQDKKFTGLGKDILDLFAQQYGYTFIYKPLPLKRRDNLFIKKKLDFIFPDNPYWIADMKKGIDIAYAPMLEFTDGVVVLKENVGKGIGNLKKLGLPHGFTPWQYLDKVGSGEIKVAESNYSGLYKKLLKGRIDGAYVNIKIAKFYWNQIDSFKNRPIVFDTALPHAKGFWYLSTIKYPKITKQFEAFMKKNKKTIEKMKKKYNFYIK